jgi:hypothetical protein
MSGRKDPASSESATGNSNKQRNGPLRNGNPRGDPGLAPRCGAKMRAPRSGPCRQPAMANGRCRLHGGLSTGPRTAEGLERLRAARTKHGFYSADRKARRDRAAALIEETRALLLLHRAGAQPMETIAPHRLLVPDVAVPPGKNRRRGGKTPCHVRKAAP